MSQKYYVTHPYTQYGERFNVRESARNYTLATAIRKASAVRGARVYALGTCSDPVYVG